MGDGPRHVFITGSRLQLTPTWDGSHFKGEERLTKRTCGTMSGLKTAKGKERQHLVQEDVRPGVEEVRASRMVGVGQQGAWTKWATVLQRKITWSNIWKADFHRIRFLLQAVYDVLPSPANLHVWGKIETPACPQCSGRGSLEHLLSSCSKALGEGRYRWRHNQVLRAVANSLATAISTNKCHHKPKTIKFLRAGEKPNTPSRAKSGLLTFATD